MEKPKRPRGRPKIPDPASEQIHVRVTPADKAKYQRAADKAGVPLSLWLKVIADRESS
jgi:hypothetical protein